MENPNKKRNWNEKYMKSMQYKSFKRKNYYISNLGTSKTYIIGYNYKKENEGLVLNNDEIENKILIYNREKTEVIKDFYQKNVMQYETDPMYNGWSILDSLISLRQDLNYNYKISENSISENEIIDLENSLSEKDKKKIIKWLKKYGMPFLGDKIVNNGFYIGEPPFEYGFKNDLKTCLKLKACACRLGTFLIAINIIYMTLVFYMKYVSNIIEPFENVKIEIENYATTDISSYIRKSLSSISDKAIINVDNILNKSELPKFEGCCETIISLAMYQLAIVMSSKNKFTSIKVCRFSECKHIFIPTRKTRLYCMNCSRQKQYKSK